MRLEGSALGGGEVCGGRGLEIEPRRSFQQTEQRRNVDRVKRRRGSIRRFGASVRLPRREGSLLTLLRRWRWSRRRRGHRGGRRLLRRQAERLLVLLRLG